MPNKSHAIKKMRQDVKRRQLNRTKLSKVRNFVKKVEMEIATGKAKEANAALRMAMSQLHKAAQKGLLKKNNAARKISRLNKRIKNLSKKSA